MDVERDIIRFEVIPALNQMFNKRGVDVQAIDLRYGVNTSGLSEAEATDKVLNMCVQSIDRARPFFVGFLGNRYGTTPELERWNNFYKPLNKEQKKILQNSTDMSITELEILYSGLFSDDADAYHYLFFMRDDINENDIPIRLRANFREEADNEEQLKIKQEKLRNLKNRVQKRCDNVSSSRCFPYYIKTDEDNNLCAPGLAQKLIEEISKLIDSETDDRFATSNKQPVWAVEGNEVRKRMLKLTENAIDRPDIFRNIEMMEDSVLICGRPFCGRSTVLAQLYMRYWEEDWNQKEGERKILLAAVVNHSQHSRNMYQILGRWVVELFMLMNVPLDDQTKDALVEAAPINHKVILKMFYGAVDSIRSAGHTIHIFIDDLDQFLISSPGDERLDWVDDRVKVYATICQDSIEVSKIMNLPFATITISDLVEDPNHVFLNAVKKQKFCELPDSICAELGDMKYTFMEINTLFKMVQLFNKDDFKEINSERSPKQDKVYRLFHSIPLEYGKLFSFYAEYFISRVGSKEKYKKLIDLLKEYPGGLRVSEIIDKMDNKVSAPEIYNMLYYFEDFVSIEYDTEIIRLRNHPALYRSYYKELSFKRLEGMIMDKASLYLIPDAMKGCCALVGKTLPTDIPATKELIRQHPDKFKSVNLSSFVINAFLSVLYKKNKDIKNAIHYADKALHVAEQIGETMDVCRGHIYWDKAVMLNNADFQDEAKTAGTIALGIFEQNNVVYEDLPDLYMLVGRILEKESDVSKAVRYYQTALKIMEGTDSYDAETIDAFSRYIQQLLK
jgi:hypothetical protein